MSWEHMKADLDKGSFHSILKVEDDQTDDCWYCDDCGGKTEMYQIRIKDIRWTSMMIGVLCQKCMVKWFRDLGVEYNIPVPEGQQRIEEVPGHNNE